MDFGSIFFHKCIAVQTFDWIVVGEMFCSCLFIPLITLLIKHNCEFMRIVPLYLFWGLKKRWIQMQLDILIWAE